MQFPMNSMRTPSHLCDRGLQRGLSHCSRVYGNSVASGITLSYSTGVFAVWLEGTYPTAWNSTLWNISRQLGSRIETLDTVESVFHIPHTMDVTERACWLTRCLDKWLLLQGTAAQRCWMSACVSFKRKLDLSTVFIIQPFFLMGNPQSLMSNLTNMPHKTACA